MYFRFKHCRLSVDFQNVFISNETSLFKKEACPQYYNAIECSKTVLISLVHAHLLIGGPNIIYSGENCFCL